MNDTASSAVARPRAKLKTPLQPLAAALIGIGCGSAILVAPAVAQTGAGVSQLSPVVTTATGASDIKIDEVSSRKATARVEDTPQIITIVPEKIMKEQAARNLQDVLRNTPGITYDGGENGFSTGAANFKMRGFDSGGNVFVDGIRDSGNYNRDIYNLESVEVIKGPQGDNGRGSPGGYVNLVTKTPKFADSYQGGVTYGFDRYDSKHRTRATADLNKVLNDRSAVRLNLMVEDGGVAGRDVARARAWGVAPSVTFKLSPDTSATLSYSHLQTRDRPDFGVPTAALPGFDPSSNDLRYDERTGDISRDNFYGLDSDYDKVKQDMVTARIDHQFSPSTSLENITRYVHTDRDAIYTVIGSVNKAGSVTPSRQGFNRVNKTLANQTNLRTTFATGSLKHTLSTGVEIMREESKSGRGYSLMVPLATNVYHPDAGRGFNFGGTNPRFDSGPSIHDKVKIDTIAAYVYDTIEFNPRWQATGGVRLEHYKSTLSSSDPSFVAQDYSSKDTTLNGSLGLVFKPQENGSIYASASLSTLPPGSFLSNPDISRDGGAGSSAFPTLAGQNNPDAKTQRAINYEIGTKWELFDKRLLTSVALFHTERRNVAMTDGTNLIGYGKQQVQGLEISATGYITPQWSVFGGVLFQRSKRKHGADIDAARKAANSGDYGSAISTSSDELAFTPKTQANLWTTYYIPSARLTLGAGMQYTASSWVGRPDNVDRIVANGVNGKLPGYVVFNAMAAYEVNKNLTLRLNIDNIADKTYATSTNWSARRAQLGAPRTFMLSADVNF